MNNLTAPKLRADELMKNDRFKMGGKYYIIIEAQPNELGNVVINFLPFSRRSDDVSTLITSPETKFKVYSPLIQIA